MTSSVPAPITCCVVVAGLVVLVSRLALVRETVAARLVNLALVLAILSALARESSVQAALDAGSGGSLPVPFTQQLGTVLMLWAGAPLTAVAARWRSPSWSTRQTGILLAAAVASGLVMLVVGTSARSSGTYIDLLPGWPTAVYFGLFSAWAGAMPLIVLIVSVEELRHGQLSVPVMASFGLFVSLAVWGLEEAASILAMGLLSAVSRAREFVELRVELNEASYSYLLILATVCAALPVVQRAVETLGVDYWSRSCRRLRPMWADLIVSCPEVVLGQPSQRISPRARAHRMCIEVRDSISLLGRHLDADVSAASAAVALADAAHRRSRGCPARAFTRLPLASSGDLKSELGILAELSKDWPPSSKPSRVSEKAR